MTDASLTYSLEVDRGDAGAVVVHLDGQVDLNSVDIMRAAITDAARTGPSEIVLDLRAVDFIDSSGLRQIVTSRNELETTGCRVCVDGLSGAAQRLLEVAGLIDRLQR